MIRRALVSFLALTLLHLNAGRGEAGCSAHDGAAHAVVPEATMPAAHHGGGSTAHDIPAPDCDGHGDTECCAALAACALAFEATMDARDAGARPAIDDRAAWAVALDAPRGIVPAPDPPPPKR